ncbi:MAG: IS1182 family transposase [Nanoarchaeota archaeon]
MKIQKTLFSDKEIAVGKIVPIVKKKIVFKSYSQAQDFLLPKSLHEFVEPGHIARLISEIIDEMNIDHIIETYQGGGTSAFNPRMLLKEWILGFVNKIYSCRMLAKELRENLTFIWISGNQKPDFRTLNNFRLRLRDDIKSVFKQIVQYGIQEGIIEGKDVFIDHTKRSANANRHKVVWKKQVGNQSRKIDEELDKLFDHIDKINADEEKVFGNKDLPEQERKGFDKEKIKKIVEKINKELKDKKISREQAREEKKKLNRAIELLDRRVVYEQKKEILNNRNSYSKTDNDAVAMLMKDKLTVRPAYNEGIAVEKGFVLNYEVSNKVSDSVNFVPLMEGTISNLDRLPENANADAAYGNEENWSFLQKHGIKNFLKYGLYRKEKSKKWKAEKLRFDDFIYDKEKDEFICKNNERLSLVDKFEEITRTGYVRAINKYQAPEGVCINCPFRALCTKSRARTIELSWKGELLKQQARANLESEKGKELRKRRGNEIESVFGDGKLNKNKDRYLLRGLSKVNIEAGLYYISHNVRKIQIFLSQKAQTPN